MICVESIRQNLLTALQKEKYLYLEAIFVVNIMAVLLHLHTRDSVRSGALAKVLLGNVTHSQLWKEE